MKKILLSTLFAAAICFGHEGEAHTHKVTDHESLLWLKDELTLTGQQYRVVREEIQAYKASKSDKVGEYKDSIFTEVKKENPDKSKIATWSKKLGDEKEKAMQAFANHFIELRKILSAEQIDQLLAMHRKVYKMKEAPHKHSHKHADGKVHTHNHTHDSDHKHLHEGEEHKHSHKHDDGKVHTHDHSHEGDHKHLHPGENPHKHSHKHADGKVHTHNHESHSDDHEHSHEDDEHKHSHKHDGGKVHTHDHIHENDHSHKH